MAKLSVYFLVIVVLCQSIAVFSRQIHFDSLTGGGAVPLHRQVRQATTTTNAPASYTACFNACRQTVTTQYNPVCASNGQFYTNRNVLQCAQMCDSRITEMHVGTCGPSAGGK